jgi:hypothetical protein
VNFATRPVALGGVDGAGRLELSTDPDRPEGDVALAGLALGPGEGVLVRLSPGAR